MFFFLSVKGGGGGGLSENTLSFFYHSLTIFDHFLTFIFIKGGILPKKTFFLRLP